MIKCLKCGYDNVDGSIYCNKCGSKLNHQEKRKILLVEPIATTNFFLTKTLKNKGFEVKSLRSPNFVFDELSNNNYTTFIIDIDLFERSNLDFLKTLRKLHPKQYTVIITPSVTKDDLKLLKSLKFSTILIKPVKTETILSHIDKLQGKAELPESFKYPLYNENTIEEAVSKHIKANDITYILEFVIKDFTKQNIKSQLYLSMLDKIFASLKRSDELILLENVGILIIPTQEMNDKGANILKNKVKKLIKKELFKNAGLFKYPQGNLSLSELCGMIIKEDFAELHKKDIKINKEAESADIDKIPEDELFKDRHLVFSALNYMDDSYVALLYLDEKMKKIVAPFITISQAALIKNTDKESDIEEAKKVFLETLTDIYKQNKSLSKDDIEEKIHSDISLMTLPEIQNNIIMLINEEASFKRIVSELQKDAAISSKVLKLVNSAFFGFSRQIKNLERATAILGTEEILGLSLSISYINSFNANMAFVKKLWRENIAVMSIIRFIENEYKLSTSSVTPSILSSIGKVFFAEYFPELYINTIKEAQKSGKIYDAVELKYFSIPHTRVGGEIIDMWRLPEKIKVSAMYHTYPSAFSKLNTSLHLIHTAKYIAGALGYSTTPQPIDNMSYYTYTMLLKKHGVDVKKVCAEDEEKLRDYIEEMMFLLV